MAKCQWFSFIYSLLLYPVSMLISLLIKISIMAQYGIIPANGHLEENHKLISSNQKALDKKSLSKYNTDLLLSL